MRSPVAIVVLCIVIPHLVRADPLPGAILREWPSNPARHEIIISRVAVNEVEKKMIATAEAAGPDQKALMKSSKWSESQVNNDLWWNKEVSDIRIPFAITGSAVDYYSALVEGYRRRAFTGFSEPQSRFVYEATTLPRQNPAGTECGFVVKMKILFSESFAASPNEHIQFQKEREIILDQTGKILQITGDGDTDVPVSTL